MVQKEEISLLVKTIIKVIEIFYNKKMSSYVSRHFNGFHFTPLPVYTDQAVVVVVDKVTLKFSVILIDTIAEGVTQP